MFCATITRSDYPDLSRRAGQDETRRNPPKTPTPKLRKNGKVSSAAAMGKSAIYSCASRLVYVTLDPRANALVKIIVDM